MKALVEYALLIVSLGTLYTVGVLWVVHDAVAEVLGGKGFREKLAARIGAKKRQGGFPGARFARRG